MKETYTITSIKNISPDAISIIDFENRERTLRADDIVKISIATTDQGPFMEDVFLEILDVNEDVYSIGQDNPSYDDVYGFVSAFPGFDYEAVIKAMGCTDYAEFTCWTRN